MPARWMDTYTRIANPEFGTEVYLTRAEWPDNGYTGAKTMNMSRYALRWQVIDRSLLDLAATWEDGYFHDEGWWYADLTTSTERGPFATLALARSAYGEWHLSLTGEDDRGAS